MPPKPPASLRAQARMTRVYLDHNATTPLRPEARAAMLAAMDAVGNPSSVHAEGRAAKAIVEKARAQVSNALGASEADIVFTSGATEAAALAFWKWRDVLGVLSAAKVEHDAVNAWVSSGLKVDGNGIAQIPEEEGPNLEPIALTAACKFRNRRDAVHWPHRDGLRHDSGVWESQFWI